MKHLFYLLLVSFLFVSCQKKSNYSTIEGSGFDELNGETIYLHQMDETFMRERGMISKKIENGKFSFCIESDTISCFQIHVPDLYSRIVFMEPGVTRFTLNNPVENSTTTRTKDYYALLEKGLPAQETEEFIFNNINNALGLRMFYRYGYIAPNDLEKLYSLVNDSLQNTVTCKSLKKILDNTRKTEVGDTYIDIQSQTLQKEDFKLSDLVENNDYVCVLFSNNITPKVTEYIETFFEKHQGKKIKLLSVINPNIENQEAIVEMIHNAYKGDKNDLVFVWDKHPEKNLPSFNYSYRIWNYYNYTILINAQGIVEETIKLQ